MLLLPVNCAIGWTELLLTQSDIDIRKGVEPAAGNTSSLMLLTSCPHIYNTTSLVIVKDSSVMTTATGLDIHFNEKHNVHRLCTTLKQLLSLTSSRRT
jgi:hypothetical protein